MSEPDPDIERAHTLADQAKHDSITAERLTNAKIGFKRYRLHQDSLYHRLAPDEQPHFLFHADKQTPVFSGPAAPTKIDRSRLHKVMHLITDSRWLIVAGNKNGDQERDVALKEIKATNFDTNGTIPSTLSNNVFVFEIEGAHYWIPLANDYGEDDFEELSRYLRDGFGAIRGGVKVDSDAAGYTVAGNDSIDYEPRDLRVRLDQIPEEALDEANERIAETDSVEELIALLDELIEDHTEHKRTLDNVVEDSSSIDELRREVETSKERAQRQAREHAELGVDEMRQTLRRADPAEVREYGLGAGKAMRPLAYAAPFPTNLLIAASIAVGSVAGLHASGRENSPLADIDAQELSAHVTALADAGQELEEIDGEVAGALLGAIQYLGGDLFGEEYAKWLAEADPEAIMAGADAGARFATTVDDQRKGYGIIAGAGLGLLASYNGSGPTDDLRETVDSDLYKEYIEELSHRELEVGD